MLVFVSLLSIIQQQIRMDDGIFWKIEALQSKTNPIDPVVIVTQQLLVYDATRHFDMSHDVGSFGFCGFDTWLEWIEICVTWCACALCVCMYDVHTVYCTCIPQSTVATKIHRSFHPFNAIHQQMRHTINKLSKFRQNFPYCIPFPCISTWNGFEFPRLVKSALIHR